MQHNNTEGTILANVLDSTRQLTRFYLSKTADLDVSKRFEATGFTTNSIHWIVAHLAWAENFLILQAIGNTNSELPWFEKFGLGTAHPDRADMPPYEEALQSFNTIHQQCLEVIKPLNTAELDTPNHLGLKFGNNDSMRMIIQHAIRHEGTHAGHLGWLLRMHGKRIV